MSVASEARASASSAAEASSSSEQSVKEAAQTSAGTDDADVADGKYQTSSSEAPTTGTTVVFGDAVPAVTTSNTIATPTDSRGSTMTDFAASTSKSSTLSTSPSTSSSAASVYASDSPYHGRGPENSGAAIQTSSRRYHAGGPSPGQIAAAVIVPLFFLIALVFTILFLRRRRRRNNAVPPQLQQQHHPMVDRSGAAFAKEGITPKPHLRNFSRSNATAPILTTTTNNTYYTGLSTPTTPSRTTSTNTRGPSDDSAQAGPTSAYDIPPPAYAKLPPPGSTPTLPQLSFPSDPFMDPEPVSPLTPTPTLPTTTAHTNAALAALSGRDTAFTATSLSPSSSRNGQILVAVRPDVSRAGTMRSATAASVTSDMYSETASVHSAKPARMSGAPNVVVGSAGGGGGTWLDFESENRDGDVDGYQHRVSTGSEYAPGWIVGGHGGDPFRDPR